MRRLIFIEIDPCCHCNENKHNMNKIRVLLQIWPRFSDFTGKASLTLSVKYPVRLTPCCHGNEEKELTVFEQT